MSDQNEIKEALEFNELWWNNVQEGEPIAQDEIDEVKGLIAIVKSQQELIEQQTIVFEKIKAEMDRFMSLLNINFETHGTIEDQAKAYNDFIEQKDAEIEKLREIQRALVLTPMQKMSRTMDTISQFNEKEGI